MRLWSQQLISKLPSVKDYKGSSNQLGGQHTEIRMILGKIKKHGKVNHSTVNYINNYSKSELYAYGLLIIDEMIKRGFNISQNIINEYKDNKQAYELYNKAKQGYIIFKEHNKSYLQECINNLNNKGIDINVNT